MCYIFVDVCYLEWHGRDSFASLLRVVLLCVTFLVIVLLQVVHIRDVYVILIVQIVYCVVVQSCFSFSFCILKAAVELWRYLILFYFITDNLSFSISWRDVRGEKCLLEFLFSCSPILDPMMLCCSLFLLLYYIFELQATRHTHAKKKKKITCTSLECWN